MIIDEDTPLRLEEAARRAFPNGGMTAYGLRREAERGRLVIERIANKDYTTLRAIGQMRELCRVAPKGRVWSCKKPKDGGDSGSSATGSEPSALDALQATAKALKENLAPTSRRNTTRKPAGQVVIPIRSK